MLKIKDLILNGNLILAPMQGVNCGAFRRLCKESGAALVSTPMVVINKLAENPEKEIKKLDISKQERPVSIQLVGSDGELMKKAVSLIEDFADIIDINLGCPEKDILALKAGSFFIKHPDQLKKIIPKAVGATNKPVTAKIRVGWDESSINTTQVVKILEDFGVNAISVHARTTKQKYSGKADWAEIRKAKETCRIPIIGNGDVSKPGNAKSMQEQTRCDGIMIGRGVMGNPLLFKRTKFLLENGSNLPETSEREQKEAIWRFLKLYQEQERQSISELKQQVSWFSKGLADSQAIRSMISRAHNAEEVIKAFETLTSNRKPRSSNVRIRRF